MEGFGATSQLSGFLRFQPKRRDDLLSHLSIFPSYHFQIFHHFPPHHLHLFGWHYFLNSKIITISDRFHQNHKIFQFPPAQLSLPPLIDSIAIKLSCTLHHHCQYSIINVNIFVIGANIFIISANISIIRIKTGNIWQFSAQSLSVANSNKLYF